MSKKSITPADIQPNTSELTGRISTIIETARNRVKTVVDTEMVRAYWEIGREIVEDEQQGEKRAGYGEYILRNLSRELTASHGKGFDSSNLKNMRQFYLAYPIGDALRSQLSWTHYRLLMRHDDPQKRSFYEIESVNGNWSTRELERQLALPVLLARNSNSLPLYKYLAQYAGELPERVQAAIRDKSSFDDLLSGTIRKSREKHSCRHETITSLCSKLPDGKCLQALPHLKPENIDIAELHAFLVRILKANPSVLKAGEQAFKTDLKRAIRIYDWLRYRP